MDRAGKEAELRKLTEKLERAKELNRSAFLIPNGKQEAFELAVGAGKHKVYLFCAANAIGKDTILTNIMANVFWGPQNDFFKGPLYEAWPFPKNFRFITESQLVKESGPVATEIRKWWPKGRYEPRNAGKQFPSEYKTDTGFFLDVMTYEQAPEEFEGVTLGAIFFSEPPPEDIFNRCVSRLRQGGIIVMGMTPLTNAAWVMDRLLDSPDTFVMGAEIEDGCKKHGVRGHLEHKDIEWMVSKMDPDELEARTKGKFMHLNSTIFGSSFKRDLHIIPNEVQAPPEAQWGITVDPAGSKPFSIIFWWVDARGQIVIDDEWPHEDFTKMRDCKLTIRDYVQMWKQWQVGKTVNARIIDRHFANARDYRGRTLMGELCDDPPEGYGMEWQNSPNMEEEIENGVLRVKQYLAVDPILKQPMMLFKARVTNTIRSMERWPRDPDTFKPDVRSPYKDFADTVRYTCMSEPEIYISAPFKQQPPPYAPGR
jgi:phage terminase large subunit-like protein